MNNKPLSDRIDIHINEFLKKARSVRTWLLTCGILVPVFVGAIKLIGDSSTDKTVQAVSGALELTILLFGALAALLALTTDQSALAIIGDAQDASTKSEKYKNDAEAARNLNEQLIDNLTRIESLSQTIDLMRLAVDTALSSEEQTDLKSVIENLIDLLIASKMALFGFGDEQWNFSIYIWNETQLDCLACRRPSRAESEAPHRSWLPGEGHVGKAFQMQRALVCADTTDVSVRGFFDAPENKRLEYDDAMRYRSIAAIPIFPPGERAACGVVVCTSDVADRFAPTPEGDDHEAVLPIRALSKTIATLMAVSKLRGLVEKKVNA
jgi:hypothetical protein